MTGPLDPINGTLLAADASEADGVITTRFRGTADIEGRAELAVFVKQLHERAVALHASKVVVDFRELKFMNSSSFKCFVTWLAHVQELPKPSQYKIQFLSNPSLHWQRRSLAALGCFAVDLVSIETT